MVSPTTQQPRPLKGWERWLYGGVGSIAPTVVAGITTDLATTFQILTWFVFFGWLTRSLLLFVVGGFVSFLHRSEIDPWKAFVIGISAPALITTYMAANNNATNVSMSQNFPIQIAPTAFAQDQSIPGNFYETHQEQNGERASVVRISKLRLSNQYNQLLEERILATILVKEFIPAPQSRIFEFLTGLLGTGNVPIAEGSERVFVAGIFSEVKTGKQLASLINSGFSPKPGGENAVVYDASKLYGKYFVVLEEIDETLLHVKLDDQQDLEGIVLADYFGWEIMIFNIEMLTTISEIGIGDSQSQALIDLSFRYFMLGDKFSGKQLKSMIDK